MGICERVSIWALFLVTLNARANDEPASSVFYLEQQIEFFSSGGVQQRNTYRLWFDSHRLRADIEGGKHKSVLLLDDSRQEVKLLFPPIRSWARYSLEEYAQALAMRFGRLDQDEVTLEITDREEKVGNWNCRIFQFRSNAVSGLSSELCLADIPELPPNIYAELMRRLGLERIFGRLYQQVRALEKIPVYIKSKVNTGSENTQVEQRLLLAEKRSVPVGLFAVPKDYKEITDLPITQEKQGGEK